MIIGITLGIPIDKTCKVPKMYLLRNKNIMNTLNIEFTDKATEKILAFIEKRAEPENTLLRVTIPSANASGYNYQFFLDEQSKLSDHDVTLELEKFKVVLEKKLVEKLNGATVDWVESVSGSGFKVDNPNRPHIDPDQSSETKIQQVFEHEINPALASHGGKVELIEIKDLKAFVKLSGGCQGCSSSTATLKHGIEKRIREIAPEILEVVDVTDHASGENPYFQ
ncbi:MAG TPA: iron-sulfur cluster assembly accessory protein [Oligoflexia bacterium]|nr:iron-sulfur cluster assembly accessory protein [Oligoflexia bacterium]HMR24721.1 iron-sulfur cluster assembly accessory protein [Oligoflexia bacterium]